MENKSFEQIKNIVLLSSRLQNLCEGFDETNKSALITSKIKILLEISQKDVITPNLLKHKVGLAKSNVTIICNQLIKDDLISKTKDTFDSREILYSITKNGKEYLNKFLKQAQKNFENEIEYKNSTKQIYSSAEELLELVD